MSEQTTVNQKSAFQKWTEKNAQLWQVIKFTLASCCSGLTEFVVMFLLCNIILVPLSGLEFNFLFFKYDGSDVNSGVNAMIAYLVSTTVGNMISFVINRKKTFKSATNPTFSVVATLVMIVFIICVSTYVGPEFQGWISSLLNGMQNESLKNTLVTLISKSVICCITFVFVFLMDKFVILREPKKSAEEKEAEKKAQEEAESRNIKVVNNKLAAKFLTAAIILLVLGVAGLTAGSIIGLGANSALCIAMYALGSVCLGIGIISLVAFIVEKTGDKLPPEEAEALRGKSGYTVA